METKQTTPHNLQLEFLKQLEKLIPNGSSLANELADLFNISIDSAYRRLRGETSLTFEEIVILCDNYNLSLESAIQTKRGNQSVIFGHYSIENTSNGFKNYLRLIHSELKKLHMADNPTVLYAAEDIPFFYHFNHPNLAAFKLFYWMNSILQIPELKNQKFNFEKFDSSILETGNQLGELYTCTKTIEVWTELTINSIIKQIEFYWDSGLFEDTRNALIVCKQLSQEIELIKGFAENSTKTKTQKDNFVLYNSEVEIGNNCILAKNDNFIITYLTHLTFNMINTKDKAFCAQTENWFENLIQKSNLISGSSEKIRNQFFNSMQQKVENLRIHIESNY